MSTRKKPKDSSDNFTDQPFSIEALQATTKLDIKELIKINDNPATKGLTLREKGKLLGCSHMLISQTQTKLDIIQKNTKQFKDNKADILAEGQRRILNQALSNKMIENASFKELLIGFGILSDKEHRERQVNQAPRAFMIYVREVHHLVKSGSLLPDSPFAIKDPGPAAETGPVIDITPEILPDLQPNASTSPEQETPLAPNLLINKDSDATDSD